MPFSSLPDHDLYGTLEPTPATHLLTEALRSNDLDAVVAVMSTHWEELWWALPPALTGDIIALLPTDQALSTPGVRMAARFNGVFGPGASPINQAEVAADSTSDDSASDDDALDDTVQADDILLRAIQLRLAGRPWDALALLDSSPESFGTFGQLREDLSAGRVPARRISVGLIALLGERFAVARQQFGAAARVRGAIRFPWVQRSASALLALTHALEANHAAARLWIARAESLPRTRSWAEERTDEHLQLAMLIIATDTLELDEAQALIAARPSPFDYSYLWPFASDSYTQFYLLREQSHTAQSMWHEILETVPHPTHLQGAARRVVEQVPLRLSLATEALSDAAERMEWADTPATSTLSVLADYVAGNVPEALNRSAPLLPQVKTQPRLLVQLLGVVAGCHHAMGNESARDDIIEQFLEQARMLGLWAPVALSPLPLREHILAHDVPEALREALAGAGRLGSTSPALTESLTPAEVATFQLLAAGRNRKEISVLLHLSENTVKTHLRHIYRKLGVSTRAEAMSRANEVRALVLRSSDR